MRTTMKAANLSLALALVANLSPPVAAQVPPQQEHVPAEVKALHIQGDVTTSCFYWDHFAQSAGWHASGKAINWTRFEREGPSSAFQRTTFTYTTSYELSAVAYRAGGDEIFVGGLHANGRAVIERWSFPQKNGRWRHVPPATAQFGVPLPAYLGTTEVKGGTWDPEPPSTRAPKREVLLDSPSHGCPVSLVADPEGRFILWQDYDSRAIYRIRLDLVSPGSPEVMADPATIPELANTIQGAVMDDLATGRRTLTFREIGPNLKPFGTAKYVLFHDNDNDGLFDGHVTGDLKTLFPNFPDVGDLDFPWWSQP